MKPRSASSSWSVAIVTLTLAFAGLGGGTARADERARAGPDAPAFAAPAAAAGTVGTRSPRGAEAVRADLRAQGHDVQRDPATDVPGGRLSASNDPADRRGDNKGGEPVRERAPPPTNRDAK